MNNSQTVSRLDRNDYIAGLLRDKNISKIVLIDDLYDNRSRKEFDEQDIKDFLDFVELEDEEAFIELNRIALSIIGKEIKGVGDIDDQLLDILWKQRNALGRLKKPIETHLFSNLLTNENLLNNLRTNLTQNADLEILCKGRDVDVETDLNGASLVFIDYYLGDQTPESVTRAVEIAKRIYAVYSSSQMPLIVLMSTVANLNAGEELFRKNSGLLKGMFYFFPKTDLGDVDKLTLNLAAWAKTLPLSVDIQHFIKTLESSLGRVKDDFIERVKSLQLGDYSYIQNLSLQEDGHPLGDYMSWLFNSYLGHLLFENDDAMRKQQKVIDSLINSPLPPNQTTPSPELMSIYHSALFNSNVGEIAGHPAIEALKDQKSPTQDEPIISILHLGDLFVKNKDHEVLMIINAECDLAFGIDRKCDIDDMVFLICGKLSPPTKWTTQTSNAKTEFFEFRGEPYRILWNTKKVYSYRRGEVEKYLSENGYKREVQMRQPFALEIQRAFAADLTRIGMPVAPPLYHPVKLQLLYKGEDKRLAKLGEVVNDGGFWVAIKKRAKQQSVFFFTVQFGQELKKAIQIYANHLQIKIDELGGDENMTKRERVVSKKSNLEILKNDFERWFLEMTPVEFSFKESIDKIEIKEVSLHANEVGFVQGKNEGDQYDGAYSILINIVVENETDLEVAIEPQIM